MISLCNTKATSGNNISLALFPVATFVMSKGKGHWKNKKWPYTGKGEREQNLWPIEVGMKYDFPFSLFRFCSPLPPTFPFHQVMHDPTS